jgi:hypothetical protein
MNTPDLSKASCPSFFKAPRAPKQKKKSAAEKREGMSERHLELIRKLPCCCCGQAGGQAHHLKLGTGERGMGLRSTDKNAVPMCHDHHINGVERAGAKNEFKWFMKRGVNPLDLAAGLWAVTGNIESMLAVMTAHKQRDHATPVKQR